MNRKDLLRQELARKLASQPRAEQESSFKEFAAAELYCPTCKKAMPVKEKTLLYLTNGELQDYICKACGTSLGTRQG